MRGLMDRGFQREDDRLGDIGRRSQLLQSLFMAALLVERANRTLQGLNIGGITSIDFGRRRDRTHRFETLRNRVDLLLRTGPVPDHANASQCTGRSLSRIPKPP